MSESPKSTLHDFMYRRLDAMIPLRKGLDAFALRQKVIASNIANSETPNYKAKRVSFESELAKVLNRQSRGLYRTDRSHIPVHGGLRAMERLKPEVIDDNTPPNYSGVNNVDIDREMARMATNQIHFAASSKVMAVRYRMMMTAIRGR